MPRLSPEAESLVISDRHLGTPTSDKRQQAARLADSAQLLPPWRQAFAGCLPCARRLDLEQGPYRYRPQPFCGAVGAVSWLPPMPRWEQESAGPLTATRSACSQPATEERCRGGQLVASRRPSICISYALSCCLEMRLCDGMRFAMQLSIAFLRGRHQCR